MNKFTILIWIQVGNFVIFSKTNSNLMTKYSTKTLMLIPVIAIAMIAGTATQVMAIEGNGEASIKVRSIEFKNHGVYDVHLQISSGNEDLVAGKILVTSDVSI